MNHLYRLPLTLLCLLLLNPFSLARDNQSALDIPVRIAVIGDRTGGHVPGVFEDIVAEVAALHPDIVFTVGDQIEGYTDDSDDLTKQWDEYDAIVAPIRDKLHLTPGNHDIFSPAMEQFYRQRVGDPYYSLDYRGIHFTVLDVGRWDRPRDVPAEQIQWLENDLKQAAAAERRLVFLHKPMWFSYIAAGNPDPLHEIFKNNRVDLVMTGHYHYYFSGEYDGVKYISLGSSGGSTQTDPMDVLYQYAYITVDMAGVHPVVLKKGSVLDWDYMTAADYNIIYSFPREGFAFDPQLYFEPSLTLMPASFNLSVKNLGPDALADTLRWIADEGWKIEPKEVPLRLEPGDSCLINFSASSELQTAQLPYFELKIPFRPGYSAPIDYPLDVSRRTRAAAMSSAPLIDGNLGEWQGTAETLFFYGRANPLPDGATKIVFAHDDANLFVSGSADFPPDYKLKADAAGRDSAVYNDDCFGFFFCPDPSSNTVYQIYINPMGVIFDQKLKFKNGTFDMDRAWDGNVEVKTTVGTDGWTMEARIPYLELGLTGEAAEEWLVNFRRKMPGFNEAADWRQPISYDPASFGVLRLE